MLIIISWCEIEFENHIKIFGDQCVHSATDLKSDSQPPKHFFIICFNDGP